MRRVGFGAANVTEVSAEVLSAETSRSVVLLVVALDFELDDLGAGSEVESGCLDEGAFLMNLPDESLGWAFDVGLGGMQ